MSIKLIAESGSTKTDWVLLEDGKRNKKFKTEGINPYLQTSQDITAMLAAQLPMKNAVDELYFYGAGINGVANKSTVNKALQNHFAPKSIAVESDMLAAARGLSKDSSAMICILGTGSNACFYDGKKIKSNLPSLGYIAGDEGSGNYMGKRILQYYAYNTFDLELKMSFEAHFGNDINLIIDTLYKSPFPNRYLASFVPMLAANRGHYMVENIIEDSFTAFFQQHLFKYRQSWLHPICFTGSIAYVFADVIKDMCHQNQFELGAILQNPMDGLIKYHR